jgi:hypothetical protein
MPDVPSFHYTEYTLSDITSVAQPPPIKLRFPPIEPSIKVPLSCIHLCPGQGAYLRIQKQDDQFDSINESFVMPAFDRRHVRSLLCSEAQIK